MSQSQRAIDLFKIIGAAVREYRNDKGRNFTGLAHVSIDDMQCLVDESAQRAAERYKRPAKSAKAHHGFQARMVGVRVLADKDVPSGTVELETM